jgi:SAM-dependent methyltransferase
VAEEAGQPPGSQREEARRVYGTDAAGYEAGRPDYPAAVYEVLRDHAGVTPGASVLEIGPGSGRVTSWLLGSGAYVVGVEPDRSFVHHLHERFGARLRVIESTFEAMPAPERPFDVVVAAMSFHWVDHAVGLPKLRSVVRPGGAVSVWWTLFSDPARRDPFGTALRALVADAGTAAAPTAPFELDVAGWRANLIERAGLTDFRADVVPWIARFDADGAVAHCASLIAVRRLPTDRQDAVLAELATIARRDFGGVVERPFVTAQYTARCP